MRVKKYDENTKCIVCGNIDVVAKGMCRHCYYRSRSDRSKRKKYDENIKCIVCGETGVRVKDMCLRCYQRTRIYIKKNIIIDKYHDQKRVNKSVCKTLEKHHDDLINDTERLTTEFLQKLINVKCDIKEK